MKCKEEFKNFVDRQKWIFAKTYAEKAPHEYIVRNKTSFNDFIEAADFIQKNGIPGTFWGNRYIYYYLDDKKYWTMGYPPNQTTIINRADYDKKNNGRQLTICEKEC